MVVTTQQVKRLKCPRRDTNVASGHGHFLQSFSFYPHDEESGKIKPTKTLFDKSGKDRKAGGQRSDTAGGCRPFNPSLSPTSLHSLVFCPLSISLFFLSYERQRWMSVVGLQRRAHVRARVMNESCPPRERETTVVHEE